MSEFLVIVNADPDQHQHLKTTIQSLGFQTRTITLPRSMWPRSFEVDGRGSSVRAISDWFAIEDVIGDRQCIERIHRLAHDPSLTGLPVLIEGEPGVGKHMIAHAIHRASNRASRRFVAVDSAEISIDDLEAALTGAGAGGTCLGGRQGDATHEASCGTLYLKNVQRLTTAAQSRLLAILTGDTTVAATTLVEPEPARLFISSVPDLIEHVRRGTFDANLFYRLGVLPIRVPRLRDRLGEFEALSQRFLARFSAKRDKRVDGLTEPALAVLRSQRWPGNLRELASVLEQAAMICDGAMIEKRDLPFKFIESSHCAIPESAKSPAPFVSFDGMPDLMSSRMPVNSTAAGSGDMPTTIGVAAIDERGDIRRLESIEADMIRLAICRYRGRLSETAKRLGIGRSTLYRKLQAYGLTT